MADIKPIHSDHPGAWHREKFAEFAAAKARVGEPTPHMNVLIEMCRDADDDTRIWRAGAYAATYSLLSAEAIWREWSLEAVLANPAGLREWLADNWAGIHTRTPRRAVRTPEKMAHCLHSYANWLDGNMVAHLQAGWPSDAPADYEHWWDAADHIWGFGRYINIRLLELYRRWEFMNAPLFDVRAVGAHSPIRCLMLLEPPATAALATGDTEVVNYYAEEWRRDLEHVYGVETDPFHYAALLCEYRKSYEDRGDYPGNQTDEELAYLNGPHLDHWINRGYTSDIYRARAVVSPLEVLGEHRGWRGRRKECAAALRDHGVVWNDWDYDYAATVANGGAPVPWAEQDSTRSSPLFSGSAASS